MGDPVREGFEALRRTKPYLEWAESSSGNAIDARKLDRKLAGEKTPKPRSGYALSLWRMLDAPPPVVPLSPIWQRDIVFSTSLSSFHDPGRTDALERGWTVVAPELLHGANSAGSAAELRLIGDRLRREGWSLAGWGTYGQGTDPEKDGIAAGAIVAELGLDGWIANGETWAEGKDAWKSRAFLEGWAASRAPKGCPLSVSCNGSDTNLPREFDYEAWLEVPGAAIMPQAYTNVDAGYTWEASLEMLTAAGVPRSRISMTFGTWPFSGKPIPFDRYKTWPGPRGAYVGERMPAGGWAKMERAS